LLTVTTAVYFPSNRIVFCNWWALIFYIMTNISWKKVIQITDSEENIMEVEMFDECLKFIDLESGREFIVAGESYFTFFQLIND
jgi:hypothetical protein